MHPSAEEGQGVASAGGVLCNACHGIIIFSSLQLCCSERLMWDMQCAH